MGRRGRLPHGLPAPRGGEAFDGQRPLRYIWHMSLDANIAFSQVDMPTALARELGGAQFALLFGSAGTPYFTDESDVDVAVQYGQRLGLAERLRLAAALAAVIGRAVDLVDLREADPVLAFQVLKSGRIFLLNDPHAYRRFAARVLSEYADFKLDRRPIEAALMRGGGR